MRKRILQVVERRLRQVLPEAHVASTIGDLAEDFDRARATRGPVRASLWLIRESASLVRAYRATQVAPRTIHRLMLADDVRLAWRRLAAHPSAAAPCALLLSIGIGLSTAMFSVVDSLLLTRAPFRDGGRLVEQTFFQLEPTLMQAWRTSGLFEKVEAGRPARFRVGDSGEALAGAYVTPGVFEMLDVRPIRGRVFSAHEAWAAADESVVLSEAIWRSMFGGDPAILGRRIRLAGTPATVIGIMPATFRFPAPDVVVWRLLESVIPNTWNRDCLRTNQSGCSQVRGRDTGGAHGARVRSTSRQLPWNAALAASCRK